MKKAILLLATVSLITVVNAKVWRVNNTPGVNADFSDLQVAIDATSVDDTIYVEGSTNEQTSLYRPYKIESIKKQICLIGPGYFLQENESYSATNKLIAVIEQNSNSFLYIDTLANFSVFNSLVFNAQISLNGADNIVFNSCLFKSSVSLSYTLNSQSKRDESINNTITKCYFKGVGLHGEAFNGAIDNSIISNNIFDFETIYNEGANISGFCGAVIKNNVVMGKGQALDNLGNYIYPSISGCSNGIIYNNITAHPIENNSNSDVNYNIIINNNASEMFSDPTVKIDNHFMLNTGSPAVGTADDGGDCGAFGGSEPYVLSGLPTIPHIYEVSSPVGGSATGGLPVKIKVKTQN